MNVFRNSSWCKNTKSKFVVSVALILLISSVAKIVGASGGDKYLQMNDPILGIQFRSLLILAAAVEIATALFCIFGKHMTSKLMCIGFLSANFMLYRISLLMIDYNRPCLCLGNLTTAIHVSPHVADNVMKGVLAYLLVGSYGILFHEWWKGRAESKMPKSELPVDSQ